MRTHGGGVLKLLQQTGIQREELLDFSASINPLGLPESVKKALIESLSLLTDYPEIDASSLRQALAKHHQLPVEMVLPANGSTSLIYLLPRVFQPKRALLVAPCFSEYRPALLQQDCVVDELVLSAREEFSFNSQTLLDRMHPQTDLVWLANPGNPSGRGIEPQQLVQLAKALAPTLLVVDEAFVDFCPQLSLIAELRGISNLLLLRSMTKFYAIPGLRVGYLLAAPEHIDRLAAVSEPWQLSTPAICAACACLADESYQRNSLAQIPQLRDDFVVALQNLGLQVFPSVANYLLLRLPEDGPSADQFAKRLLTRQVLVRSCSNFSGLDQSFVRLAVRSATENAHLLTLLAK